MLTHRLIVEGAVTEWRYTDQSTHPDVPVMGPGGVIGHIGLLAVERGYTARSYQANLLVQGVAGRLRAAGGGGAGALEMVTHLRSTVSDCTSRSPAFACQDSETTASDAAFSAQAVGGVDVMLAQRFSVFGLVRLITPVRDIGSGDLRVLTGARVGW